MALYHSYLLPWTVVPEENQRLKRNVLTALVIAVIFGLTVPFLPVKKVDRSKVEELPPRLAQLVVEKHKPKPPPPPKVEKKKPKKKKEKPKKKKEKKKEVKKKKPKPKPKEKTQAERVAEARKKAQSTGLLALSDELSDLRDTSPKLNNTKKLSKGATKAKTVKRNILTSNQIASSGSGGIDTSRMSTGIGSSELAGRETTKVESPVEKVAKQARIESSSRKNKKPSRTYEEVSLVFDKNKGAIYSIYNRALRRDPTLEGKLVIEITIAPSGQVTNVRVVSSELNAPDLEQKLLTRISLFNFGAKDVEQLIVTYPIDFLPP
ncbi:MAG: AgmX/PglI C-terminal domain-containing protein [Gammaproteobacteria bacterium]